MFKLHCKRRYRNLATYSWCTTWRENVTKTAPARRRHSVGGGGGGHSSSSDVCCSCCNQAAAEARTQRDTRFDCLPFRLRAIKQAVVAKARRAMLLTGMVLDSIRHLRSRPLAPPSPALPSPVSNTDLIRISEVGAEYECADWLPASTSRHVALLGVGALIGLVRSADAGAVGQPTDARVLPCYTTVVAAAGRGRDLGGPWSAHCPALSLQLSISSTGPVGPTATDGGHAPRRARRWIGCACRSVTAGRDSEWLLMRPEWKATSVRRRRRYLVSIRRPSVHLEPTA